MKRSKICAALAACLFVCCAITIQGLALEDIPDASTPAASEEAPTEPTASEPTASEPTASEPTASEPTASEPTTSEPTASELITSESEIIYQRGVALADLDVNPPDLTVEQAIIHIRFCLIVLTFYYLPLYTAVLLIWQFFKWIYGLCMRAI